MVEAPTPAPAPATTPAPAPASTAAAPAPAPAAAPDDGSGIFTVRFENFSKIHEKRYSEPQTLGPVKWRIMFFPRGNAGYHEYISAFLEVAEPTSLPPKWHKTVHFKLALVNQLDPAKLAPTQETTHTFTTTSIDWGFNQFFRQSALQEAGSGWLLNDTLVIQATITAAKLSAWSEYYDPKKETGCVGLKNQGATCYMNSLLQALFHTATFRRAVYAMPNTAEDTNKNIPQALQRVFYLLQTSNQSVGTKQLTKSFGWDAFDSFTQHDVQELNRVLCDNLEEKMKGSAVDGTIPRLYEGKALSYIRCINITFESKRVESFYDLSLNVKGCSDIYASFDSYIEEETMNGDNKYMAEGHGLQDAKRGCMFLQLPPVLNLQLKRFEYDPMRDANVKVNDKLAFSSEIDLSRYVTRDPSTPPMTEAAIYSLYGVLVHSGDVHGGHYYAYLKVAKSPGVYQWLKFDDERVTVVEEKEAIDDNFGGEEDHTYVYEGRTHKVATKKFANAYMLIYVLKSRESELLAPCMPEDVPAPVRAKIEQDAQAEEAQRKTLSDAHLYASIRCVTEKDFKEHMACDLSDFAESRGKVIKIKKADPFRNLRPLVEQAFEIPAAAQRFWVFVDRENKTCRPQEPISEAQEGLPVSEIQRLHSTGINEIKLFIQVIDNKFIPRTLAAKEDISIFVKFFDATIPALSYLGGVVVKSTAKIESVVTQFGAMAGITPQERVLAFEEVKPTMIDKLDLGKTFSALKLGHGDIIVFQKAVVAPDSKYKTAEEYYDFLLNRVVVTFKPLDEYKTAKSIDIQLLKKNSYEEVLAALAKHLGADAAKIRLTLHNSTMDMPKMLPYKRGERANLGEILTPMYATQTPTNILYYEILEFTALELETNKMIRISYFGENAEEKKQFLFLLNKDALVADLMAQISKAVSDEEKRPARPIRILDVFHGRISRIFDAKETLFPFNEKETYRAEEIPEEETKLQPGDKIVQVQHYQKTSSPLILPFGYPFYFVLKQGEPFSATRERIRGKLGVAPEQFSKWKFATVTFSRPEYIAEDKILAEHDFKQSDTLGLEHQPPKSAHGGSRPLERSIKIYN